MKSFQKFDSRYTHDFLKLKIKKIIFSLSNHELYSTLNNHTLCSSGSNYFKTTVRAINTSAM